VPSRIVGPQRADLAIAETRPHADVGVVHRDIVATDQMQQRRGGARVRDRRSSQ
jgi:hypothetical protein